MNEIQGTGHDTPLIRVEDVSFSYSGRVVLENITFEIRRGDFLAIIGPNGSGKSTLIKLILKLLNPDQGEIFIDGKPIEQFEQWDLFGYVPQKATHIDPLFPISVSEVVSLERLSMKRFPRWFNQEDGKAVRKALELVGMDAYRDRRIGDLSGGQQQRVFIARAIVNSPGVLFLDEPTTGIDARAQDEFYGLLDELNRQGITIVLVTHDVGVVNKHVNRVACLNQRMAFHGSHEEFCSSAAARALIPGEHHLILHRH